MLAPLCELKSEVRPRVSSLPRLAGAYSVDEGGSNRAPCQSGDPLHTIAYFGNRKAQQVLVYRRPDSNNFLPELYAKRSVGKGPSPAKFVDIMMVTMGLHAIYGPVTRFESWRRPGKLQRAVLAIDYKWRFRW